MSMVLLENPWAKLKADKSILYWLYNFKKDYQQLRQLVVPLCLSSDPGVNGVVGKTLDKTGNKRE